MVGSQPSPSGGAMDRGDYSDLGNLGRFAARYGSTIDPTRIRTVSEAPVGQRIDWGCVKPIAGGGESCRQFGNLSGIQDAAHGSAVEIEGDDRFLDTGEARGLQFHSVDGMCELAVTASIGEIADNTEQIGGQLDGGSWGEQESEVGSIVITDDADLAVVSNDAWALPVGVLTNHSNSPCSHRGVSAQPTIAEGGAVHSLVVNDCYRAPGGPLA